MVFRINGGVLGELVYVYENGDAWVRQINGRYTYFRDELIVSRSGGMTLFGQTEFREAGMQALDKASKTPLVALSPPLPSYIAERLLETVRCFNMDEEVSGYAVLDLLKMTQENISEGAYRIGPTRLIQIDSALARHGWTLCDWR